MSIIPTAKSRQTSLVRTIFVAAVAFTIAGCATQAAVSVRPGAPGFFWGLWNGWTVVFSFIGSLFSDNIAIYAVPNNGGWYNFGFALGVGAFSGGGAAAARR